MPRSVVYVGGHFVRKLLSEPTDTHSEPIALPGHLSGRTSRQFRAFRPFRSPVGGLDEADGRRDNEKQSARGPAKGRVHDNAAANDGWAAGSD